MNWFNCTDIVPPKLEIAGYLVIPTKQMRITKSSKTVLQMDNNTIVLQSEIGGWVVRDRTGTEMFIQTDLIDDLIRLLQVAQTEQGSTPEMVKDV